MNQLRFDLHFLLTHTLVLEAFGLFIDLFSQQFTPTKRFEPVCKDINTVLLSSLRPFNHRSVI